MTKEKKDYTNIEIEAGSSNGVEANIIMAKWIAILKNLEIDEAVLSCMYEWYKYEIIFKREKII